MVNFKKIDEKDFVFINKPLTIKEEKEFSEFLKLRKTTKNKINPIKKRKELLLQS